MNQVYIDKDYFNVFQKIYDSVSKEDILQPNNSKVTNFKQIINMLSVLQLNTNLNELDTIENLKNKNYSSLKEAIIFTAIKNDVRRLKFSEDINNITDYNGIFFSEYKTIPNKKEFGVVSKSNYFDANTFYDHCNISDFKYSGNVNELKTLIPPANAMIICDNFIFQNENKIISFIQFLKMFKAEITSIKFHLTVFTIINPNATKIKECVRRINELGNIEVQVIETNGSQKYLDRQIYTNYSTINIGHPFGGIPTTFSQNFLSLENDSSRIKINYVNFQKNLKELKSEFLKSSNSAEKNSAGMAFLYQSNPFSNRLFDMLPKE